jgi:hypothetical protein
MAFVEARAKEITSGKLIQAENIKFLGGAAAQVLLLSTVIQRSRSLWHMYFRYIPFFC